MEEDVLMYIEMGKSSMDDSLQHLSRELAKIRAGKASPSMLNGLSVEYYGSPTPMQQVANISSSDAKTLVIQPWEKSMLAPIEKAIFEANLGVTPMNDGEIIRIVIPPLTEDRRRLLVKRAKDLGEDTKVSIRNARRDVMNELKKAVKDGYPEDAGKRKEGEVQEMTNNFGKKVDELIKAKEADIMTV